MSSASFGCISPMFTFSVVNLKLSTRISNENLWTESLTAQQEFAMSAGPAGLKRTEIFSGLLLLKMFVAVHMLLLGLTQGLPDTNSKLQANIAHSSIIQGGR